jgi:hypothetical protein
MKKTFTLFLFVLNLCMHALVLSEPVRLQYVPSIPVQQTSKLTIEVHESLPVLNLTSKARQIVKFDLTVGSGNGSALTQQVPLNLSFSLKDIFVDLCVNQEEMTFEPKAKQSAIPLIQLSELIDKPLHFEIDAKGCVIDEAKEIEKNSAAFPALRDIPLKDYLEDLVRPLFVAINKDLEVGSTFQQTCTNSSLPLLPVTWNYEVKEITERDIVASISGTIDSKQIILAIPVKLENHTAEQVEMIVKGTLSGEISWNRANALLYGLQTECRYQVELKAGEMKWDLQASIEHKMSSVKL